MNQLGTPFAESSLQSLNLQTPESSTGSIRRENDAVSSPFANIICQIIPITRLLFGQCGCGCCIFGLFPVEGSHCFSRPQCTFHNSICHAGFVSNIIQPFIYLLFISDPGCRCLLLRPTRQESNLTFRAMQHRQETRRIQHRLGILG